LSSSNQSGSKSIKIIPIKNTGAKVGVETPNQTALNQSSLNQATLNQSSTHGSGLKVLPPLSLYIHLPWCIKKCPYCDFNSHEHSEDIPEAEYLQALERDLEVALPAIWGRPVQTIFIGGGTPSLFSAQAIDQLLTMVRARVKVAPDAEVTMEANPGTFEAEKFAAYRQAGVNRLSVGVQTFNDQHLKALGRIHDASQAKAAAALCAQVYETWNIDLMYGLPSQTIDQALVDLQQAIDCDVPHISLYNLTLEPNTFFATHPPELPDDDTIAIMQEYLQNCLVAAGYQRYEVSAWCKPGHQAKHNKNYWEFGDYLGIGAGAHSKISSAADIRRQVRVRTPKQYMEQALLDRCVSQDNVVPASELPFEFMLNALRLVDGVTNHLFEDRTGLSILAVQSALNQAVGRKLLETQPNRLRATPQGMLFLNELQTLFL
jgi:putative oxygen-independent coproporphyrinogen III oxidase